MVTLEEVDKLKVNVGQSPWHSPRQACDRVSYCSCLTLDSICVAQELKAACKELGLEQTGNKADLVARVKAALEEQAAAAAGEGADAAGDADNGADAAAGDSKPAAEAGATEAAGGTDASGAKQGDAGAADAGQQKGRAKIQFNEAEAAVS